MRHTRTPPRSEHIPPVHTSPCRSSRSRWCMPSNLDASEPVTSSVAVLRFWLGNAMIQMLPSATLLLPILVPLCGVFGSIPSSVVVPACLSPANAHDAPVAQRLLAWAVRLSQIPPRVVRLDAASWRVRLIAWIPAVLGAVAVIPWTPGRRKNRSCFPPPWTKEAPGTCSGIERFFGWVFLFVRLQRPPLCGWSEVAWHVALTSTASIIVGLAVLISSVHLRASSLIFGRAILRYETPSRTEKR